MNKKRMNGLIGVLLVIMLLATACSGNVKSGADKATDGNSTAAPSTDKAALDPYGKSTEPITINIAQKLPSGDITLPAGQTIENNGMTKIYEDVLNIKLNREWSAVDGDPYNQKVMLSIASREIPDAMMVNEEQLRMLVKANLLEDLTVAFDDYASPKMKELHIDLAKSASLNTATFDGRLYGIPDIAIKADAYTLLWVRKDWLDKLKLPEPKTIDDIENIAQAFIDNKMGGDNTIGLLGPNTPELANDKGNRVNGFDAIFSSFHSFPGHWIKNTEGKVTYGSIEPETKEALAKLRDLYAKNLIDKEFFLRENPKELFLSGQNGMFFGPWWMGWGDLTQSFEKNPDAQWKAYSAPADKDGKLVTHLQPISRNFLVVRKGFKNPEAIIKAVNMRVGVIRRVADLPEGLFDRWEKEVESANIPDAIDIFRINADDINAVTFARHQMLDALDGKVNEATLQPEIKEAYGMAKKYMDDRTVVKYYPDAIADGHNLSDTGGYQAYIIGGAPLDNTYEEVSSLLYSPTETMKTRWANLLKLEDETFLKIVIGNAPLDSFDSFVKQWRSLGGDTIIKEVEETIK
ncbi:MAG: extracellular solute-binding protein [Gorillibacterium sp.]|nr:extracellular solute-binding protein [Gorillibacterium sp.]